MNIGTSLSYSTFNDLINKENDRRIIDLIIQLIRFSLCQFT